MQILGEWLFLRFLQHLKAAYPEGMKHSIAVVEGACGHPSFGTTPKAALRKLFCSLVSDVALHVLKASDQGEVRPEEFFEASNKAQATVHMRQNSGVEALAHMLLRSSSASPGHC